MKSMNEQLQTQPKLSYLYTNKLNSISYFAHTYIIVFFFLVVVQFTSIIGCRWLDIVWPNHINYRNA